MKYIFIADFFIDNFIGGGELCNDVLIKQLQNKNNEVIKIYSHEVTEEFLSSLSEYKIIVANFINLSEKCKKYILDNRQYVIYEHDHKYLKTRDPSLFDDYKAPHHMIINEEFYNKADSVIAQSNLHGSVIQKNLPKANVVVAGVSLWSDEQLDFLKQRNPLGSQTYVDGWFVLDSKIIHKGTEKSVEWCKKNGKKYHLNSGKWEDIIETMKWSDGFVFFPQTLETMSRIVVEARMCGLKVVCSKNIGAVHEDWFKLKGEELIEYHRNKRDEFVNKFNSFFLQNKDFEVLEETEDVTAILTLYKRPQNLIEQVIALKNQTKPPKEIWLWINDNDSLDDRLGGKFKEGCYYKEDYIKELEKLGIDRIFDNNHNWKFYGRFAAGLLADTKYIAIYDDDTIPGSRWHENCLKSIKEKPGIYGTAGVILQSERYNPHLRVGWPNPNNKIEEVDLCGHGWFFERDCLNYLWREKPVTWDNGEDIALSFMCQKHGKIKTYIPPHPKDDKSWWGSLKGMELGTDEVATSNNKVISHERFFSERDFVVKHCLDNGWRLLKDA